MRDLCGKACHDMMHGMRMQCFQGLRKFKFVLDKKGENINCINKFKLITTIPFGLTMEEKNQNKLLRQKGRTHPLWRNVGVQILLLMKLSRKLQDLLFTRIELGFKGVLFFL